MEDPIEPKTIIKKLEKMNMRKIKMVKKLHKYLVN